MALKLKYAKKEEIPAGQESFYTEKNGEWLLDAEVEDVSGLKSALQKEREAVKTAKDELSKWTSLGDPTKAKAALDTLQALETEKLKEAGKFDALQAQLIKKHDEETKVLLDTMATKEKAVEKLLVDNVVISAVTAAKGKVKVLLPHIKGHVKAVLEDGEYKAVVIDGKGNPRIGDGKGTPMTIEQLVEEFKADPEFMPNFEADGKSGSGAAAGKGGKGADAGRGKPGTVALSDQKGMNANLADIASGKVAVTSER